MTKLDRFLGFVLEGSCGSDPIGIISLPPNIRNFDIKMKLAIDKAWREAGLIPVIQRHCCVLSNKLAKAPRGIRNKVDALLRLVE